MRILVVCGASGGHIFPALSFLEALKDRDKNIETLLVLPKRSLTSVILPASVKVKYISILPLACRPNLRNLKAAFLFFGGSLESLFIFIGFKPDIAVGFGGIETIPLMFFAWLARINTLVHEQNVVPGLANRLLAKFADKVAVSFASTRRFFNQTSDKVVFTGNPLRKELKRIEKRKALSFFGFDEGKFSLLVMGGSQASRRINSVFLQALAMMPGNSGIQVIHLCGAEDFDTVNNSYAALPVKYKVFVFLKEMKYAYSACDLAVCRAGATTIAELLYFNIPAIIIPYPFARHHQLENALLLEEAGLGIIIKEDALDAQILKRSLQDFMNNPARMGLPVGLTGDRPEDKDAASALTDVALSLGACR